MAGLKILAWIIVPGTFAVAVYLFLNLIWAIIDKVCGPKIWPLIQKLRSDKSVEVEIEPEPEETEQKKEPAWKKKRDFAVITNVNVDVTKATKF